MGRERATSTRADGDARVIIGLVLGVSLAIIGIVVLFPLGGWISLGQEVQYLLWSSPVPAPLRNVFFDISEHAPLILIVVVLAAVFVGTRRGAGRARQQVARATGPEAAAADDALETRAERLGITVTDAHRTAGGQFVLRDLVRVLEKHQRSSGRSRAENSQDDLDNGRSRDDAVLGDDAAREPAGHPSAAAVGAAPASLGSAAASCGSESEEPLWGTPALAGDAPESAWHASSSSPAELWTFSATDSPFSGTDSRFSGEDSAPSASVESSSTSTTSIGDVYSSASVYTPGTYTSSSWSASTTPTGEVGDDEEDSR